MGVYTEIIQNSHFHRRFVAPHFRRTPGSQTRRAGVQGNLRLHSLLGFLHKEIPPRLSRLKYLRGANIRWERVYTNNKISKTRAAVVKIQYGITKSNCNHLLTHGIVSGDTLTAFFAFAWMHGIVAWSCATGTACVLAIQWVLGILQLRRSAVIAWPIKPAHQTCRWLPFRMLRSCIPLPLSFPLRRAGLRLPFCYRTLLFCSCKSSSMMIEMLRRVQQILRISRVKVALQLY